MSDISEIKRRAARSRWDAPENVDARLAKLAEHVERVVSTMPPLSAEQRRRLAALLSPSTVDRAG